VRPAISDWTGSWRCCWTVTSVEGDAGSGPTVLTMQLSDHRDDSELWAGKGVIDATVEEPDANFEVQQVESIVMKLFRMPNRRSLH